MSDTEERTEKPSPHRLRKAREEGDAASSVTLTIAVGFASTLLLLWLLKDSIRERLSNLLTRSFDIETIVQPNISLWAIIAPMFWDALNIVLPFLAAVLVASTLCGVLQTRGMFSIKRVRIDPNRMNPGDTLKQRFSTMQLFELIKLVIKFALVATSLFFVVKGSIGDLVASMFSQNLWNGMTIVASNILLMAAIATIIYFVAGTVDYIHQYFEFIKRNRMTKSEVKQEIRDLYGDPHINSQRKEQRDALIMGAGPRRKAKPSVIVTNPTHFAVALFYEPGLVDLPIVVAKGRDQRALAMREQALDDGIPIAERPPLARRLHRTLAVGQTIGQEELEAVAEVFRWIRQAEKSSTTPHKEHTAD